MNIRTKNDVQVTVNGPVRKAEVDNSTSVTGDMDEGATHPNEQEVPEFDPTRGPPCERRPEYVH